MRLYILDEQNSVVRVRDLFTWARWFENATNRIVGYTQINSEVLVSTVFLGIDHAFVNDGPPVLFETMLFGAANEEYQHRYSSYDDAKTGHDVLVRKLRAKLPIR